MLQIRSHCLRGRRSAHISSKSGDSVIIVDHSGRIVLIVDALPLEVVVVHVIDVTVDEGLPHVHHPDQGESGEGKSNPVAREADVKVAIALIRS